MVPGIDPRIDIAFKKVFGSESTRHLLTHFANAVLEGSPLIADLELMNPYSEQMALDDKLSILDVKARDSQGRLYNLEMQMVSTPLLARRFLYYWSRVYSQQLGSGSNYRDLRATISICIVNGVLFPQPAACHHEFGLWTKDGTLRLSRDLVIHVLELPKFGGKLGELETPLDSWLYFLQNGNRLDADDLPSELDTPQIRQAMEVLKMLAQNDLERELYEGRLKAQRDKAMMEAERERAEAERERAEAERERAEAERERAEAERERAEAERADWEKRFVDALRERDAAARERDAATCERDMANRKIDEVRKLALIQRIQLCERLMRQEPSKAKLLIARSDDELQQLAAQLEQQAANSLN